MPRSSASQARHIGGVDEVPGGEVATHPACGTSRASSPVSRPQHLAAEQRQDAGQFQQAVEVGAGAVHAVVGQDVVAAFGAAAARRGRRARARSRRYRRRCRPPARAVRGRSGFRGRARRRSARAGRTASPKPTACAAPLQRRLRAGIALGVVVDEEHQPAQHVARDRHAGLGFGTLLQAPQVAADDVAVAHGAAATDVGALVQQAGAQDAFHRPHQAAVDAVDVGRHGGAAMQAVGFQLLRRCVARGRRPRSAWSGSRVPARPVAHHRRRAARPRPNWRCRSRWPQNLADPAAAAGVGWGSCCRPLRRPWASSAAVARGRDCIGDRRCGATPSRRRPGVRTGSRDGRELAHGDTLVRCFKRRLNRDTGYRPSPEVATMPKSDTPRRWFGLWPAAARRPQDDPADLGTAFGLDLSLDELADDTRRRWPRRWTGRTAGCTGCGRDAGRRSEALQRRPGRPFRPRGRARLISSLGDGRG